MYPFQPFVDDKKPPHFWGRWLLSVLFMVALVSCYLFFYPPSVLFSSPNSESIFPEALLERDDPNLTLQKDLIDQQQTQFRYSHKVISGETLAHIFKLYGLDHADLLSMIKLKPQAITVLKGQVVEWEQDVSGHLLSMQIHRNARLSSLYIKENDQFRFKPLMASVNTQSFVKAGRVGRNFYQSARAIGLTRKQIQTIATVLYWQVDVTSPMSIGDKFAVELEQVVVGQQGIGTGTVSAIRYQHNEKEIEAIRFTDGRFYYANGESTEKSLDRLPLQKHYPISSKFNPHRLNPVTHQYAPHYGTDLATPIGTPVYATGDGVVKKVGHHPLAGKYVVISHGRIYSTHFFHLSHSLVNVGDKIQKGRKIALTGNTGRSTGPHLHYELRLNGQPIDAMQAPLPHSQGIPSSQYDAFKQQVKKRMSLLQTTF